LSLQFGKFVEMG